MHAKELRAVRSALIVLTLPLMAGLSVSHCCAEGELPDTVGGEVIEVKGTVEVKRSDEEAMLLQAGDIVHIGDLVIIRSGSTLLMAVADKTVRRFAGPTAIEIKETPEDMGGSVLANLGSGVVDLLFAQKRKTSEAVMATRTPDTEGEMKCTLPVLISPSQGSALLEIPGEFRWQKIVGVPLYRVSVYSSDRMLWQGTTSDSRIRRSRETCELNAGETYYWVVEALVGNSSVRSETAEFTVLDRAAIAKIRAALSEVDSACSDPELGILIKVRLCLDWKLHGEALRVIDSHFKDEPHSQRAHALRAQAYEEAGLVEQAMLSYKRALSLQSAE
jgi:hypothetical protein